MPRYFLHLHDAGQVIKDLEGQLYSNPEDAVAEAEASAREMLADKIRQREIVDGQKIEIVDEDGELVKMIPFRDQIRLVEE